MGGFGERKGWLEKLAERNPDVVVGQPQRSLAAVKAQGRLDQAPTVKEKPAKLLAAEPPKMRPNQYESDQQVVVVDWFRGKYPHLARLFYAVPNGGHRHKATASKLQDEGVVPGIPDLTLAQARAGYAGLYLENKYGPNDTSTAQDEVAADLVAAGYQVGVFWTVAQAQAIIDDYLAAPPTLLGLLAEPV